MFPLGLIPYVLVALMGLAAVGAAGWKGYQFGRDSRAEEVAELRMAIDASRQAAIAAEERATGVAERVRTVYQDRVKVIRETAPAQIQLVEVIKREVDPNCSLPPEFRLLWDNPAPGGQAAESPPGTAVPLGDLAEVTPEARERFERNKAKLDALQSLLKDQ